MRKQKYAANPERAKQKAREWARANPERVKELGRQYRAANWDKLQAGKRAWVAANAERIKAQRALHYAENRERLLAEQAVRRAAPDKRAAANERTRQWRLSNPERQREGRRRWARNNPEKRAAQARMRQARLAGAPADLVLLSDLLAEQDYICYLCDEPIDPDRKHPDPLSGSVDHVVPLLRGGTGLRENLRAAHMVCNSAKCHRLAKEMSA